MSSGSLLVAETLPPADRALVLSSGLPIHIAHALLQDGLCSRANKSGKRAPVCTPALWLPGPEDCWLRPACVTCMASSCLKGKKNKTLVILALGKLRHKKPKFQANSCPLKQELQLEDLA